MGRTVLSSLHDRNFDSCRSPANSLDKDKRGGVVIRGLTGPSRHVGLGGSRTEVLRGATRRPSFYWNFTQCVRCVLEEENQHVANASSSTVC